MKQELLLRVWTQKSNQSESINMNIHMGVYMTVEDFSAGLCIRSHPAINLKS